MNHKICLHGVIFVSSLLSFVVLIPKTNGILTDTNELDCTHVQCPADCPLDSYIKSIHHEYDEFDKEDIEDLDDYVEDLITPEPYNEEYGHFEELPPEVEIHETNLQHSIKERQKREVFFQEDIDRCCGNQKCICKGCADVPKCMAEEVAIEVQEGKAEPGNCCSQYKCVKKEKCSMGVKQTWWKNKCTKCSCFGEDDMCIQHCTEEDLVQNCFSEYLQKPMMNGATWKEGRCISCSCEKGERRCFAPKLEDDCHPLYVETKDKEEELGVIEEKINDIALEETTTKDKLINTTISLHTSEESTTVSQLQSTIKVINSTDSTEHSNSSEVKEMIVEEAQNTTQTSLIIDTSTMSSVEKKSTEVSLTDTVESESLPKSLDNSSTLETQTSSPSVANISPTVTVVNSTSEPEVPVKSLDNSSTVETQTSTPLEEVTTYILSSIADTAESTDKTETTEIPKSLIFDDTSSTISRLDNSFTTTTPDINFNENLKETSSTTTVGSAIQIANEVTTEKIVTEDSKTESSSLEPETLSTTTFTTTSPNTSPTTSPTTSPLTSTSDSSTSSIIDNPTTEITSIPTSTTTSTSTDSTSSEKISITNISVTNSQTSSTTAEVFLSSSTSSPYSSTTFSSSTPSISTAIGSSSTSSTSAPDALEPIFQPVFGNYDKDECANTGTQNQLRHMFDEIDYVVMIVLFIGSLLCISLGLIIRHTKNRKKMYSSIPNSETSLSQTSTNTMMTV